jgi:hypothetical protein
MHSAYDPQEESYGDAAAGFLRIALAREQTSSQALLDHLERTADSWAPADRDATIARLQAAVDAGKETARAEARLDAELASLRTADRATFHRAAEQRAAGQIGQAWQTAKPLFAAYPTVYAVQDLRCQIAMQLGVDYSEVQRECEPLINLAAPAKAKSK